MFIHGGSGEHNKGYPKRTVKIAEYSVHKIIPRKSPWRRRVYELLFQKFQSAWFCQFGIVLPWLRRVGQNPRAGCRYLIPHEPLPPTSAKRNKREAEIFARCKIGLSHFPPKHLLCHGIEVDARSPLQ